MADFWWILEHSVPLMINGKHGVFSFVAIAHSNPSSSKTNFNNSGIDKFEEQLDTLTDGGDESDWISQLYSKLSSSGGLVDQLSEDFDDTTISTLKDIWGLESEGPFSKYIFYK